MFANIVTDKDVLRKKTTYLKAERSQSTNYCLKSYVIGSSVLRKPSL